MQAQTLTHERNASLDAFKFLGIWLVVLIHADALFTQGNNVAYSALNLIARVAVPVYFIISGYFVEQRYSLSTEHRPQCLKILWRLLLPFAVWSFIYLIIPKDWPGFLMSDHRKEFYAQWMDKVEDTYKLHLLFFPKAFPIALMLSGGKKHLWFLFALIFAVAASFMLRRIMPQIYVLACAALFYGLGLLLVTYRDSFIGIKIAWKTHDGTLSTGYVGSMIGFLYFELGRFIYRMRERLPSLRLSWAIALGGILATFAEGIFLHQAYGLKSAQYFYLIGTIPYGIGVFLLLLHARQYTMPAWLAHCGRYSLGMYAIHRLFLDALTPHIAAPDNIFVSLLLVTAVFIVSCLTVLALGRVTLLRKILA